MNYLRKILVISFFSLPLTLMLVIPMVPAQETVYNGVDTENCPMFSVYPSEVYYYNATTDNPFFGWAADELYSKIVVLKGNISDYFKDLGSFNLTYDDGYSVWIDSYGMNGTIILGSLLDTQWAYWNESLGFGPPVESSIPPTFLPVNNSGTITTVVLNEVVDFYDRSKFENIAIYPNIYSLQLWNDSAYYSIKLNYTEDGILLKSESKGEVFSTLTQLNYTLMSQPAQLPPAFSFTTTSGDLTINSNDISLALTISAADNNNDGVVDTDYVYRVNEGGVWSNWAVVTPFVDYDLGAVPAGNYTLTVEIKNMYGVFQEQIEVEYTPTSTDAIPGYSAVLILIILGFSISILFSRYRKKL